MWDLRPNLVSKERKNGEGQEKKREEEEEEEKKKRREEEREIKKVWILVRFGMDLWISFMEF